MEKLKEDLKDPAKFEASLKEAWAKIDDKGEGSISFDKLELVNQGIAKYLNIPIQTKTTPEQNEAIRKFLDPNNTGRVTFEGFKNIVKAQLDKMKELGKI